MLNVNNVCDEKFSIYVVAHCQSLEAEIELDNKAHPFFTNYVIRLNNVITGDYYPLLAER